MKLKDWLDRNYTKERQVDLKELYVCNTNEKLTSLEGIDKLINLTYLDCSNNCLTSLEGIEHCSYLTHLDCSFNCLTSLKGIDKCSYLISLECRGNELTSLKGIENLVNLKELYCYYSYKSVDLKIKLKELNIELRKEKIKKLLYDTEV